MRIERPNVPLPDPTLPATEADPPRVALVTGGTDGIGRAVALSLARSGDRVLFVGRDAERGAQVLSALNEAAPALDHAFLCADLSLLSETARVADEVERASHRLDAIVCCAGILSTVPEWTREDLERSFVLNYLTRYLLVRRLLPRLERASSGRVVLVSNAGKYDDTLRFDDLQYRRGRPGLAVSGRTQFANDLFATELAARARGTGVEVACVFPGVVRTSVFRNARGVPWWLSFAARILQRLVGLTPETAALTPVHLARSPQAIGSGGRFYGPKLREIPVPERALRVERREALWRASEEIVRGYLG